MIGAVGVLWAYGEYESERARADVAALLAAAPTPAILPGDLAPGQARVEAGRTANPPPAEATPSASPAIEAVGPPTTDGTAEVQPPADPAAVEGGPAIAPSGIWLPGGHFPEDDPAQMPPALPAEALEPVREPHPGPSRPRGGSRSLPPADGGTEGGPLSDRPLLSPGGAPAGQRPDQARPPAVPVVLPLPAPIRRITAPAIGLDSPVVESPIENGEWRVPKFVAGHLQGTALPGEIGNVALSGHVQSISSGNVFARIGDLKPSDLVLLTTDQGTIRYRVAEQRTVPNDDLSVVAPTATPRLTLITCTGTWNPLTRDYSHRIVVTAEPETGSRSQVQGWGTNPAP
ncbi:MAG: sortase [Chloroflexi bacterium]|nr:sortase [Chloroflexota bacterium]